MNRKINFAQTGMLAGFILSTLVTGVAEGLGPRAFYVPENPQYTIVDSVQDSVRFTLTKTLQRDSRGHLVSLSSFVDPEGQVMGWHDFGNLEGPGWAANAVGGAWEIYTLGKFLHKPDWQSNALCDPRSCPGGRIPRRADGFHSRLPGNHQRPVLPELQA